jgi:hypothetical protein
MRNVDAPIAGGCAGGYPETTVRVIVAKIAEVKMPNMSYCRFENTANDLRDCQEHMDDTDDLSPHEQKARLRLIRLCSQIASDYEDELESARREPGKTADNQ